MSNISEVRQSAEAAFKGYTARSPRKTRQALFALAAQLLELFGPSEQFAQVFRLLDEVKQAVEAVDWETGTAPLLAILATLRSAEARIYMQEIGYVVASKLVGEKRQKIMLMYREAPEEEGDSGWRFFSGKESQAYVSNPENLGVYDASVIAEADPAIVPLLVNKAPCAFRRENAAERFVKWDMQ
jgi:hypothetical protein